MCYNLLTTDSVEIPITAINAPVVRLIKLHRLTEKNSRGGQGTWSRVDDRMSR